MKRREKKTSRLKTFHLKNLFNVIPWHNLMGSESTKDLNLTFVKESKRITLGSLLKIVRNWVTSFMDDP